MVLEREFAADEQEEDAEEDTEQDDDEESAIRNVASQRADGVQEEDWEDDSAASQRADGQQEEDPVLPCHWGPVSHLLRDTLLDSRIMEGEGRSLKQKEEGHIKI
jgi:hypothetical protein